MEPLPPPALDALLAREPAIWRGHGHDVGGEGIPSGYAALDAALPAGGWARGSVTELLLEAHGIGELSLLLPALRTLTGGGGWAAFVAPPYLPYAPALANAGLGLERLLVVESGRDEDTLWAAEQLLRAGSLAAVVAWVERSTPARQRRLQLAAENGRALAVVYRPAAARETHSPVGTRLVLGARDGRLGIDVVKARGGRPGSVLIEPSAFDEPQGCEWPLPSPPASGVEPDAVPAITSSIAPVITLGSAAEATLRSPPIVALAPTELPDRPVRFKVVD